MIKGMKIMQISLNDKGMKIMQISLNDKRMKIMQITLNDKGKLTWIETIPCTAHHHCAPEQANPFL
jgi:hypothetical protein